MPFQLESNYKPRGDQGQAIAKLLKSVEAGNRHQTLLGVTGSAPWRDRFREDFYDRECDP